MSSGQMVDVAIIGAGWYGLVAARTFLRLRPDANLVIIDSDTTVGGVWSKDRLYENLVAQVNLGLFNYIDTPMSAEGMNHEGQVTGRMIHAYLQKYAEDHDLLRHIRFSTHVSKTERTPGGWRLHFRDTPSSSGEYLDTKKLMVATGVTSIPNLPEYIQDEVAIPVIHSRDLGTSYGDLQESKYQHVMVVGAAKSAYDAVYLMLRMGKRVTWIIRPAGAGPLAILPSKILDYWTSIGVASTRLMTCLSPSVLNTNGMVFRFFQQSILGRKLTGAFWDVISHLSDTHAGYDNGDHIAGLRPEINEKSVFWANSGLGVVTLPDFWPTLHKGNVTIVRDEPHALRKNTMCLKSGNIIPADFVIMCTGWGDHFAMFDEAHKGELGLPRKAQNSSKRDLHDRDWKSIDRSAAASVDRKLPFLSKGPIVKNPASTQIPQRHWKLYRRVIPLSLAQKGDRSLAILGQIHTVQTPLVASVQTFWAILYLLGELDLPQDDVMVNEIAEWNAWTRKRYVSQGRKFPYSLYDFLPYVDTLCKDLGINTRRKSNLYAEWFEPYRPEDYSSIVEEYLENKKRVCTACKRVSKPEEPVGFSLDIWIVMIFAMISSSLYWMLARNRVVTTLF